MCHSHLDRVKRSSSLDTPDTQRTKLGRLRASISRGQSHTSPNTCWVPRKYLLHTQWVVILPCSSLYHLLASLPNPTSALQAVPCS